MNHPKVVVTIDGDEDMMVTAVYPQHNYCTQNCHSASEKVLVLC